MTKTLVVLSGGQDSASCMAWAAQYSNDLHAISFTYGQRHKKEIESAAAIAKLFGATHEVFPVPILEGNARSGLTNPSESVKEIDEQTNLPKSFVPGRNLIFLTMAASYALSKGIHSVVTGVCQTDFSGYPDCRYETIKSLETAINLGCEGMGELRIHTPLMYLTKAESVALARGLPKGWEAVALSWTCYEGGESPCGTCPACELRIKGFAEAGYTDPAISAG